jgi:polyferredoxin
MVSKKSSPKRNSFKLFYQFGILFILAFIGVRQYFDKVYSPDFEAYCPFGGLQAFSSYLSNGTLACTMTSTQIIMGLVLAFGAMLFGKLFCGFICPVGTISEWIGKLGDKLGFRYSLTGIADKSGRALKYLLLFVTVYFTLTSSELFCKQYDPYYAVVSGFITDVVLWFAVACISILLLGSIFIRLIWCKYLCPLGAISNIFRFWWFFLGVMAIYAILLILHLNISWVWPLAFISIGGYLLEILLFEKMFLLPVKVVRSEESCINCNICSKNCPQGIDVAKMAKVTHVDCNLCGDCVTQCPEKDTLLFNKKNQNWLPAGILAILLIVGFSLKSVWEIPTISEKWGTTEELSHSAVYTREGLKNIKCFGSSKAFSSRMREVKGVFGVATFVGSRGVKIWYDPQVLNDVKLQKIIFTPLKKEFRPARAEVGKVVKMTMGVENFFDPYDAYYLQMLLINKTSAIALQTSYNCPVLVSVFFPLDSSVSPSALVKTMEVETLSYKIADQEFNVKINYKVVKGPELDTLNNIEFRKEMFIPTNFVFNDDTSYNADEISILRVPMKENSKLEDELSFLASHLSGNEGIVAFNTALDNEGEEWIELSYVPAVIEKEKIMVEMRADTLSFVYEDGTEGKKANPFIFSEK